jgi:hypothetical protein
MKYMLLTYLDEKAWTSLSEAEQQQIMSECAPHIEQLLSSGKFLGGAPLHPTSSGATVRLREGKRLVTDGPFAETREQIGGYTLIDAENLDEAISIAAGFLGTTSPAIIEVRPIVELKGLPTHPREEGKKARRGLKLATIVFLISASAGARQIAASPSLCPFLSCYDAVRNTDAPLTIWERLAYSFALARASTVQ